MKNILLRTTGYTLAIVGFILGFTSKVVAQYGAWVATYRYMGNVKSEICNEPLKSIKVTLEDEKNNVLSETVTNEAGQFNIRYYSDYSEEKLSLKLTDVDGTDNKGAFITYTKAVKAFENKPLEISMAYKGKAPCAEDTAVLKEPVVGVVLPTVKSDSTVDILHTNPDTVAIQKPKETPLIPDPIDDLLVYPNPNSGEFVVSFTLKEKGNITVDIYSNAAQLIFSESFMSESGSQRKQFNMPELATGNYILSFKVGQKVYSRNFIIH